MTPDDEVELYAGVWGRLTVPIRPSSEGLALYRREMERYPDKSILVLGATPELIDMALDLDARAVVSVERFPAIIEAMRRLGTRDWSPVDFVDGDWLEDRRELHSRFTCIACDGGLLFLRYPDEWAQLFELARRNLKAGGVFVCKTWAEPPGRRDYDQLVGSLIASFRARQTGRSLEQTRKGYRGLASELFAAVLVNATEDDGSFDQRLLVDRLERLAADLESEFPDPEMVEVTHAAFRHLAQTRPGTTDLVSGVSFEGAEDLLERHGFVRRELVPLQDPPIPGGSYMFVAS